MDSNKKAKPSLLDRSYGTVEDMMKGESVSKEVHQGLEDLLASSHVIDALVLLRQKANITQAEMARRLGVTQGAISKLEAGNDENLTMGTIVKYAQATSQHLSLSIGKPLNHVAAVKHHALEIKKHLSAVAELADSDEDLDKDISAFFGEAFFNMLSIFSKTKAETPHGQRFDVHLQCIGGASPATAPASRRKTIPRKARLHSAA